MKAYSLEEVGKLVYKEVEKPVAQDGWVIVQVGACGICSSDIPRVFEKGTYHFPTIPGHEFSGRVVSVGRNVDEKWFGKKVSAFPLIPCRECKSCKKQKYELCENYDYIGSRRDGAFAEFVAVPAWNLIEIDEGVSYREAAMMEPLSVALHAAKKGQIRNTDRVAVVGTGMIGFAVAQWAKYLGAATVCVFGRTQEKEKIASEMDIQYRYEKNNDKFDVVIEAVGTSSALAEAIELADAEARIVLLGNPAGDMILPQNIYWKILRKQLSVTGSWNSSYFGDQFSDWTEVRDALKGKKINASPLITHCYEREKLLEGMQMMYQHKENYCKVMTDWSI